jgi:hypothetical protein
MVAVSATFSTISVIWWQSVLLVAVSFIGSAESGTDRHHITEIVLKVALTATI